MSVRFCVSENLLMNVLIAPLLHQVCAPTTTPGELRQRTCTAKDDIRAAREAQIPLGEAGYGLLTITPRRSGPSPLRLSVPEC